MEILPGIINISVLMPGLPLGCINLYLLGEGRDWVLVDTGLNAPQVMEELSQKVQAFGIRLKDLRLVLMTHGHPDHSGLAAKLKAETGVLLALHEKDLGYSNWEKYISNRSDWYRSHGMSLNMMKIPSSKELTSIIIPSFQTDWILKGGETLEVGGRSFRVIWTPGHSDGHVCLYDAERGILLSGDHVLPQITPNIGLYPESNDPLGDYIDSLLSTKELHVKLVLPSHGKPLKNLKQRVKEILHHHDERNANILNVLGSHTMTGYEVAALLPWKGGSWGEMSGMQQVMALDEVLAHLRYLRNKGQVQEMELDNICFSKA